MGKGYIFVRLELKIYIWIEKNHKGKMKGTFILFISLCIRSIELHRHKHHGDRKVTPIEDENEMTYIQQGSYKNKLEAEYGVNFRYLGKVKNGLDRVTVVTSIPIPRYDKSKVNHWNLGNAQTL